MSRRDELTANAKTQPFPGGNVAPDEGELRIALDKKPYAEIIGHAILEPDVEVCGVLVGRLEHDAHGPYVHVTDAIRGQAAKQEGAAVTFTHETWNHIHQEMDRRFGDREIVGWYHTHGGFGVFLSEMDTFVHRNFFTEPHHLAYVYDPLAGSEAFFHQSGEKLLAARRYWLGGRERQPAMRQPDPEPRSTPADRSTAAALERMALALQSSAQARSSDSLLPWIIAAGAIVLLVLQSRGPIAEWFQTPSSGPVLILDRNPATGRAVGIPLEVVDPQDGAVFRDRQGALRIGIELRTPGGAPFAQPGLLTALGAPAPSDAATERARHEAEAAAERWGWLRLLAIGAGALALIAAAGFAAWHFLLRHR